MCLRSVSDPFPSLLHKDKILVPYTYIYVYIYIANHVTNLLAFNLLSDIPAFLSTFHIFSNLLLLNMLGFFKSR